MKRSSGEKIKYTLIRISNIHLRRIPELVNKCSLRFSDVFRRQRKGALGTNGLIGMSKKTNYNAVNYILSKEITSAFLEFEEDIRCLFYYLAYV